MELNDIIEHFYYYACDRCKEEGLTDVIGDECRNTSCWAKKINKHLQSCKQLKTENEELKNKNNSIHSIAGDLQQRNHNLTLENEELNKKLKTIYDILDMCENYNCSDCKYEDCDDCTSLNRNDILQLIKQAKEGEE